MTVTSVGFETNVRKYLEMISLSGEEIFITQNGETIAKFTGTHTKAVEKLSRILDGYPVKDMDKKEIRMERLMNSRS